MATTAALAAGPAVASAAQPGAIFAQNVGCTDNGDVTKFATKADLYIHGSNLPAGTYYVNVTTPNGDSLNSGAGTTVTVDSSGDLACTQVVSVQDFDDTTNNGGVYSVSISDTVNGTGPKQKNFKLADGGVIPPQSLLTVQKFYDANADGIQNNGETLILGWEVRATSASDDFSGVTTWNINLDDGDWTISERMPTETNWYPTTPISVGITVPETLLVQFGNVCTGGGGGGLTLGYWSNKNGQSRFGADDLALMVALNLRKANGDAFDPTAYAGFRTWLLSANATNMAYMLSAQLAAMQLNVLNLNVSGSSLIYAPGTTSANPVGFATVDAVMAEANASLGADGNTVAAGATRTSQQALKNALDEANNNLNFVQSSPCAFSFSAL